MEKKRKRRKVVASVLALAGLLTFSLFAIAGNLEPSGPLWPTRHKDHGQQEYHNEYQRYNQDSYVLYDN